MKIGTRIWSVIYAALLASQPASAIELDVTSEDSIKKAASVAAKGMVQWYTGGVPGQIVSQIPGLLPQPYYWWEAGAMFGTLIDYWYYTGDDTYNEMVKEAMIFQVGPDENFMPPNQSKSLGNDDQAFWGIAAMSAAETTFPNPAPDQPQWLALAQAVFNSQALRWDRASCNGGLKWQIFAFNNGYNYKNSISNGCFFNLAARLGAYTHNDTYLEWATKAWDWTQEVALMDDKYYVYDGTNDLNNCTDINPAQWTYNAGVYLLGAAVMWDQSSGAEKDLWQTRVQGLLDGVRIFFNKATIMYEACEPVGNCNTDQLSFKAYLSRWMAATAKVAPWTHDTILPLLQSSAQAAATSCSGGDDGNTCGTKWTTGGWDGASGVGQQMSAMEVIQSNLIDTVSGPVSQGHGGISKGDASAGTGGDDIGPLQPIGTGDRAGAWIATLLVLVFVVGGSWWLVN